MSFLTKWLFATLLVIGCTLNSKAATFLQVNNTTIPTTISVNSIAPQGGTVTIAQVGRQIEVHIDRTQLPSKLQNKLAKVRLYNAAGQLIQTQSTNGKIVVFDTESLPTGNYIVQVRIGPYVETEHFYLE